MSKLLKFGIEFTNKPNHIQLKNKINAIIISKMINHISELIFHIFITINQLIRKYGIIKEVDFYALQYEKFICLILQQFV